MADSSLDLSRLAALTQAEMHARDCTFEDTYSNTPVSRQKCSCGAWARNRKNVTIRALATRALAAEVLVEQQANQIEQLEAAAEQTRRIGLPLGGSGDARFGKIGYQDDESTWYRLDDKPECPTCLSQTPEHGLYHSTTGAERLCEDDWHDEWATSETSIERLTRVHKRTHYPFCGYFYGRACDCAIAYDVSFILALVERLEAELHRERTGECGSCQGRGVIDNANHRCGSCGGRGYSLSPAEVEVQRLREANEKVASELTERIVEAVTKDALPDVVVRR